MFAIWSPFAHITLSTSAQLICYFAGSLALSMALAAVLATPRAGQLGSPPSFIDLRQHFEVFAKLFF